MQTPPRRIDPTALACAVGSTALWGVSYVTPLVMPGISPWDISLGRYLVYGLIGAFLLVRLGKTGPRLTAREWGYAVLFAFTGYYGCYTAMVYAQVTAGVALSALIMGLCPVCVAIVGNIRSREVPARRLVGPLLVIGLGLAGVNLARHGQSLSTEHLAAGLGYGLLALGFLTYFLVANMLFLRSRPHITPLFWSNVVGASLLGFALAAGAVRLAVDQSLPWENTATSPAAYLLFSLVLGIGPSWLGAVLWNRAVAALPASLVGQCVVFSPMTGILYACILERTWPSPAEAAGMALVFAGVLWGLKAVRPDAGG